MAIVLLENRAGEMTAVAAKLAEAGVNPVAAYVVGVADKLIELAIVSDDFIDTLYPRRKRGRS